MTERVLPGIGLNGFWDQGAPWKVGGDQNWLKSSVLTQLAVESMTTALPVSPSNGVIYIVPAAGIPANQIAARDNGAWVYFPPFKGLTAYVRDTGVLMNFDGAAWVPSTAPLASAAGASQIGDQGPVVTPYLQTVSDINNGSPISLYRFVDPTKIPAMRDFSTVYDAAPSIQEAADSGARRLIAEYGLYNMESSVISAAPMVLEGAGVGTIFNQISVTSKASFEFKSSADGVFIFGIQLRNFMVRCLTGTFFEQQHLIEMNGVRDALLDGLVLYGFRGDGFYLGSGAGTDQRHNENVRVTRTLFDGVNNQNRNAISVIDGSGVTIDHNLFTRCTRPNMPGPIDVEPNANAWHVVNKVRVLMNRFSANGGNLGEVSFIIPAAVTEAPSDLQIVGNSSQGYIGSGAFVFHSANRQPTATSAETVLKIVRNRGNGGYRPYYLLNGKNIVAEDNDWTDFTEAALLGQVGATNEVRDVTLRRERFTRGGSIGGKGLTVFNAVNLTFDSVAFVDCGTGVGGSNIAVNFNAGASSGVGFRNTSFTSPTGKTGIAIQKEVAHTFTPGTNSFMQNTWGTLGNTFQAEESDCLLSDYPAATPASVEGGTTVGTTITYAERFALYRRVGRWVEGYARFSVTTHDGSGPIEVSLPLPAAALAGASNARVLGAAVLTGLAANGSVLARLHTTASAAGVLGAIRFYSSTAAPGAITVINLPTAGTPFVIEVHFSYMTT